MDTLMLARDRLFWVGGGWDRLFFPGYTGYTDVLFVFPKQLLLHGSRVIPFLINKLITPPSTLNAVNYQMDINHNLFQNLNRLRVALAMARNTGGSCKSCQK